ncbi:MAG: hypothetical protein KFF73_04855 [Cyclobacteriaceae bacterium]|nr:hypothetical protein [Cyclobacteriaceae bacterium]
MDTKAARETLHKIIDLIEDEELLSLYVKLLEREVSKTAFEDFFNTTESDLVTRAKASLKSIKHGKTRNIKDFKKDLDEWKKDRTI